MGGPAGCKCFCDVRLRGPNANGSTKGRRRPNSGTAVVTWSAAFAGLEGNWRCRSPRSWTADVVGMHGNPCRDHHLAAQRANGEPHATNPMEGNPCGKPSPPCSSSASSF